MSENVTPESQLPKPVLPEMGPLPPEESMIPPPDIEPTPVEADLKPTPPKRGRPSKKSKLEEPAKVLSEQESDKWDYDSWINSFEWDQPGMQCKVERTAPEMVGTVQTAGHCTTIDNTPLSTSQIQEQFGGGRYHISVIGPRMTKKGVRIQRLSHKPLKIPGDPNLANLGRMGQASAAQQAQARMPSSPSHPSGDRSDPSMVRLVDSMIQPLQRRVDTAGQQSMQSAEMIGRQLQDAANMKIAATDQMLAEKDRLVQSQIRQAAEQVNAARNEAAAARQEKEKAMEDVRAARDRIYEERAAMEEQFTKKLSSVQGDSTNLIATLIPNIQQQAQNQINTMMNVFESRLAATDASYTSRLEGLERSHESRMAAQADLFKSQLESATMLYQGQIQHLQLQLQSVQAEKQVLTQHLEDTRNRMMEEIRKVNKASDPEEQIMKLGGLLETVKGITGMGANEEAAPSSGNPFFDGIMNNVGKLAEVVPHITGAIAAKAQAESAAAQSMNQHAIQQQQMQAQQQQMPQLQAHQSQQAPQSQLQQSQPQGPSSAPSPKRHQRRVASAAPAKPTATKAKGKGKIAREDLDTAVVYINSALDSNPALKPEDYANMAISSVDNNMLRRLSRQKSELVVGELESIGVLHGRVSTDEGKAWMCKLLDVLRERL